MKAKIFSVTALATFVLASCNPDVELGSYENIPEVAEHVLGMTIQEAKNYLGKQGFYFGRVMDNGDEIVVSQGKSINGEWEYVFSDYVDDIIDICEQLRQKFNETGDAVYWRALIQILPSAFLQTRTVTMSYANLRNIYFQRKNHKLKEWHQFCEDWLPTLPYAKQLILVGESK